MNFQSEIVKQLKDIKKIMVKDSPKKLSFYRYDNMPFTIETNEWGAVGVPNTISDKVGNLTNNKWKTSAVVKAKLKAHGTVGDLDKVLKFLYENYLLDHEGQGLYLTIAMTKPKRRNSRIFDQKHVAIAKQRFTYSYEIKGIKFGTTLVGYLPQSHE